MATKLFSGLLRRMKPGARERSPTDAPAPISVPVEPEVTPPAVERSLAVYLRAAVEAREAGRFDEADGLLTEAIERFPDEPRPRFDWALLPHFRLDWTEAVRRSEIVRAEFPDAPAAHVLGAIVLRELDRLDDAENLLSAARERFPDDLRLANESPSLISSMPVSPRRAATGQKRRCAGSCCARAFRIGRRAMSAARSRCAN
jgi:tetratricopeptide (TPR) repeat protein